ncbi:hypothetical protein VKT23_020734 [Stygiomarasmius scandens]|uniref:Uncharacterized protein n=1 Tax=Marasmiellus scandens TaxID=2682957 RepID=A0ABR1IM60_9AGAR
MPIKTPLLKSWSDYGNELWGKEFNHSISSSRETATPNLTPPRCTVTKHTINPEATLPLLPKYPRRTPPVTNPVARTTPMMPDMTGMLYQPTPSRPTTNYLDMDMPLTGNPSGFSTWFSV